jgi:hypothetical protein
MAAKARTVRCTVCKWEGRRVWNETRGFGACFRCGAVVERAERLRRNLLPGPADFDCECEARQTRVVNVRNRVDGVIWRVRECLSCGKRFETTEARAA